MAKVSITAAAKLAGVSRSTLYRSYIDKDLLSLSKDQQNKPCIDTSELLRVFGALKSETPSDNRSDSVGHPNGTPSDSAGQVEKSLEIELKLTKEQLEESREREDWYKKQIDALTDTMKLLEGPKKQNRPWWGFWK